MEVEERKKKVILRGDGGPRIGYGHVFRLIALAEMLRPEFRIAFLIRSPERFLKKEIEGAVDEVMILPEPKDPDQEVRDILDRYVEGDEILVLDGYAFDRSYQEALRSGGNKLVYIDDLVQEHQVADLVINHAEGIELREYSSESYTRFCLGTSYAMLRKPFLERAKQKRTVEDISSLFLSMGGTQEKEELITKGVEACRELPLESVEIVGKEPELIDERSLNNAVPSINFHPQLGVEALAELMDSCELAISPASTLSLELCAVGSGLFTGISVDNQKYIYRGLIEQGAAFDLGNLNEGDGSEWSLLIGDTIGSPQLSDEKLQIQRSLIDGDSPERLREAFRKMF